MKKRISIHITESRIKDKTFNNPLWQVRVYHGDSKRDMDGLFLTYENAAMAAYIEVRKIEGERDGTG